jgi:hypothetical protein
MLEDFFSFIKKSSVAVPRHDEMKDEKMNENSVNALHSEHLNKGISPIIACVGTWEDFSENPGEISKAFWTKIDPSSVEDVSFFLRPGVETHPGQKRGDERESYVISAIDEMDKRARTFRHCTGVVVAGKEKESNGNISIVSHETPDYLFSSRKHREKFLADMRDSLKEIETRCVPGTIDAVIVGGNFFSGDKDSQEEYADSVKLLSDEIEKIFHFAPVIITGPKVVEHDTAVVQEELLYTNEFRRLYLIRPEREDVEQGGYLAKDIKEESKKWEKASEEARMIP